ncbi:MAG: heavy-metal-associated domain-containing protein [Deltaproteobacteria bacterium]|nr:heavy-metal-associated domain-containing protein [Deltaproteobacteria bacterium]MCL5891558.1 heavy-metal-associated domain-containing protein [Deltaproteobacteria bacterium]
MNVKNYLKWKHVFAGFFAVLILASQVLLTSAFVYKKNAVPLTVTPAAFNTANAVNTDKFKVYGLVCGDTFCITSIQNALYKIKGVVSAKVDMENQEAIVKFQGNIPPETFIKAIDGASNAMFHYSAHYIK